MVVRSQKIEEIINLLEQWKQLLATADREINDVDSATESPFWTSGTQATFKSATKESCT